MHFVSHVLPLAVLAVNQVSAAPVTPNEPNTLLARDYQQFKGCTSDQRQKIEHALSDAAVLARFVTQNKDGKNHFATESAAYVNYFSSEEDNTGVEAVFAAIGKQWAAPSPINGETQSPVTLDQFTVIITCEDPDNLCKQKGSASLAITDVRKRTNTFTPSITICPAFFNDARTKNNLDSLPYRLNPGRRDTSWCKTNEKFKYFEVAGATMLHELTHLNELGQRAGLADEPVDPNNPSLGYTQGTNDVYGMKGYSTDPMTAARQLEANWQKIMNANPTPPRDQWPPFVTKLNAESYAAAALEWWFMQQCEFPNILPN